MKKLVSVFLALVLVCACSIGDAESKEQLVITFPKDETPNHTSALKEFVTGYNNVADEVKSDEHADRFTIDVIKTSYFENYENSLTKETDPLSLRYSGNVNDEPVIIYLDFDESGSLIGARLSYSYGKDSSAEYGTDTQMLNMVGYICAFIVGFSGFDDDADVVSVVSDILEGLENGDTGKLGDKQYKDKNGFSIEVTNAFGLLVIALEK